MTLVIAALMALAVSVPAFAADPTGSITVKPSQTVSLEGKTLKAYKILDATYSGTGTDQKVSYTIPASMTSFFDSYFAQDGKTGSQRAAEANKTLDAFVMSEMEGWGDNSAKIKDFSAKAIDAAKAAGLTAITGTTSGANVVFSNLEAGYYLIEDEGNAVPISALMLDTVTDANVEIELKASDKTEKTILTAGELINSKANELGIGRAVNFKVTQEIPDTTGYDYYYYMINDTMTTGLTFNPDSVVVKVGNTTLVKDTDYYLYADKTADAAILGNKTFVIAFEDVVKGIADEKYATGDQVVVTYSATVNADAVTGVDPLNNKVTVQYSNNPDKDGRGDFDEDHPGIPANDQNHPTGVGPEKNTVTYTTKVSITKIDGKTKKPLEGVEFTLTGTSKDVVLNTEEVFEIDPAGPYWLLKNGTYTTTAPQTAPTLQETTGGAGWVEMVAGDTYAGADIRVVGNKQYRPYVAATDAALTRYVIIEPNVADYTSTTIKYNKVVKSSDAAEDYSVARTGLTGSDGKLDFSQLGAGTYKLSETGVLAGYNGLNDVTFTIECTLPAPTSVVTGSEKAQWTVTDVKGATITSDGNGNFVMTIENNSGSELPSTGGMGTRILYTVGGIMLVGGAIALVSKKRVASLEK